MEKLALVAAGGAIGAVLRYGAVGWAARALGGAFPWGTLLVNVTGSLAMGVAAVLVAERLPESWARLAPFVMTGVLGGFTTFSAFSLDVLALAERDRAGLALAYAGASVLLSLVAIWLGVLLARQAWGP